MKKRMKLAVGFLSIFLAVIIYSLVFQMLLSNPITSSSPPSISFPDSCSNESIKLLWDSLISISSDNIVIFFNSSSNNRCNSIFAYKLIGSDAYILAAQESSSETRNSSIISAIHLNATQNYLDILKNITSILNDTKINTDTLSILQLYASLRNTATIGDADARFRNNFLISPPSWLSNPADAFASYYFVDTLATADRTTSQTGTISGNYSLDVYVFTVSIVTNCTPNWIATVEACKQDDTQNVWYNDSKSCNSLVNKPDNSTKMCDYNSNGIIGSLSNVYQRNTNISITINSATLNLSANYTSVKTVEFKEGNITRVSFLWNFTYPLNLKQIFLEKQSSSSQVGYIILEGLNATKTLTIDRLNASGKICIKDAVVNDISEISAQCNSNNEIIISCPGANSSLSCIIVNNKFVVSGISHSGIREILASGTTPTTCTPSWICSDWANCVNNLKTRTCLDSNNCNLNVGKPNLTQSCQITVCTSRWTCTSWNPTTCPKDETQTRTCTDNNNCNTNSGKPSESQTCSYTKPASLFWPIFIISLSLIIVIIIILIIITIKRNREETSQINFKYIPGK